MSQRVLPMFSSKSFIVSDLTFWSLIHFEFMIVYGVRKCSNFILLHVAVQFSQHHFLKRLSFLHCIFLPFLSKISAHRCVGLSLGFLSCSIGVYFCFVPVLYSLLVTIALQYILKSGRLIAPAPFFFLKIVLAIQHLLCFNTNCEIIVLVL